MTRTLCLWWTLALVPTACDVPACGPGTKRVQDASGAIECVTADAVAPFACLADGGAHIVAGNCVSQVSCGPGTVPKQLPDGTTVCMGSGATDCVQPCDAPGPNTICLNGKVRHLVDGTVLLPGETVHVSLYEPLGFLSDPGTAPLAEMDTDCGFKFDAVPVPASGLVVVAVTDAGIHGLSTVTNQLTGTGAQVVAQQAYRVDAFTVPKMVVKSWSTTAGIDFVAQGGLVVEFFADSKPPPTELEATETQPVAGVTLYEDGAPADGLAGRARARYFGASLAAIDGALTVTGAAGAAIIGAPVSGSFPTFSGMGGTNKGMPIVWETAPGGSTAQVLFVERLHPM